MKGERASVDGQTVTIITQSAATAREIAALAEAERLKREGGLLGWASAGIEEIGDGVALVAQKIGRGTFEIIANALMVVGGLIAFVSWSRLLPIKSDEISFAIGCVGVAIIVGAKVCAGRWAKELNEGDRPAADTWKRWAIAGVIVDAIAALAFSAAVVEDEKTGRIDYNVQIESLETEAKKIEFRAGDLDRPNTTAELLTLDLDQLLNQTARNREGTATGKPVREWIGWGTDTYCITSGNNTYYVDKYCPDIADAHRALLKRQAYEAELAKADDLRAQADALRAARPEASSGAALGDMLATEDRPWTKAVVPMLLMLIILVVMVTTAFIAKRNPKIAAPPQAGKS
ncbi:MAG: hypothetical protein C0421_03905 [Hyphomonas sp.]|uniref:hypothetical protein n=1 Tax=Hyphomonas sp. TaxID=87 RepID=UPI0025BB2FCE|nr:hypothetical protein [Hyphomonas sp.]MBA4337971.1 hypothetical protein [Hyphomonas sp.]